MADTQNINLIPNEPTLADMVNQLKKQVKLEMNCHHIGTVQSFNSLLQTATATVNYQKTFLSQDSLGNTRITNQSFPVLVDCPVLVLGGGGASIQFPIAAGDECLICFNDRDFDNWFAGSSNSAPMTPRLHSFTDAVIIVGIRSLSNVLPSYDMNAVTIRKGTNTIKLTNDGAEISLGQAMTFSVTSDGKFSFTNLAGEFVDALIEALSTATAGGFPLLADLTVLNTFKE